MVPHLELLYLKGALQAAPRLECYPGQTLVQLHAIPAAYRPGRVLSRPSTSPSKCHPNQTQSRSHMIPVKCYPGQILAQPRTGAAKY